MRRRRRRISCAPTRSASISNRRGSSSRTSPAASRSGGRSDSLDEPELRRDTRVENPDPGVLHDVEQLRGFLVGDDEFDLDREIAGELEELRFMRYAVASIARHGLERGAAVNPRFLRLFQEPFIEENAVDPLIFTRVEAQTDAVHRAPPKKTASVAKIPANVA